LALHHRHRGAICAITSALVDIDVVTQREGEGR
jgi:hypothetical protein